MVATRTQEGAGEAPLEGPEYADPLALAQQSSQGRVTIKSFAEDSVSGYQTWRGTEWTSTSAQPFQNWMLSRSSSHLQRADLPKELPTGVHILDVTTTDRHGGSSDDVERAPILFHRPVPFRHVGKGIRFSSLS